MSVNYQTYFLCLYFYLVIPVNFTDNILAKTYPNCLSISRNIVIVSSTYGMCHAVAEWYGAGLANPTNTAVYQCQLSVPSLPPESVNEYQWKLGVTRHTTWCTGPVSVVLQLRLVSGWGLWNGDQRRPMGLKARERTLLLCRYISAYYYTVNWN